MYTRALIRHKTSGDVFVALVDDDDVLEISYPLHYSEWSDDGGVTPKYMDLNAFDLHEDVHPLTDYRIVES